MEAPRGAREPTGTNGPTPHQPPQPRHPPPQTVSAPPQGRARDRQPHTPNRGQHGGTGNQTPPAGPTNTGQTTATRGGTEEPQPLYEPRPTHPPPNPPHSGPTKGGRTTQSCGGHSTGETPSNIPNLEAKPGRANGTAPQGVRESRKPPQHTTRGAAHTSAVPPHTPTHPRGHTHPHARATSADPTPTTPTRERAPAHTSPTHALRRAPGRPIAPALLPA